MTSPGFNVPFKIDMSLSGSRNLRMFFLNKRGRENQRVTNASLPCLCMYVVEGCVLLPDEVGKGFIKAPVI